MLIMFPLLLSTGFVLCTFIRNTTTPVICPQLPSLTQGVSLSISPTGLSPSGRVSQPPFHHDVLISMKLQVGLFTTSKRLAVAHSFQIFSAGFDDERDTPCSFFTSVDLRTRIIIRSPSERCFRKGASNFL